MRILAASKYKVLNINCILGERLKAYKNTLNLSLHY